MGSQWSHRHQDPSTAVLNIFELLEAFVSDPDEGCAAGDKGVDELFCISEGQGWAEFRDVGKNKFCKSVYASNEKC